MESRENNGINESRNDSEGSETRNDSGLPDVVSNVYVANYAGYDFSQAKKYGKLIPITKGFVSYKSLDRLMYNIINALADSTPNDYLLLSGTTVLSLICGVVWYHKHGIVKVLSYDQNAKDYKLLTITQAHLTEIFGVLR